MSDVCLFAHYDPANQVADYVFYYLREIKSASFETILISSSDLSAPVRGKLRSVCADVICRNNGGLDFGSWAEGLAKYRARIDGRLLLANDSVYGPVRDLKSVLARLTAERADWYGMVESADWYLHLQSWFMLFENHVVHSDAFASIFEQDFVKMGRWEIIHNGEIGLSRALDQAGFRRRVAYRASDLRSLPAIWRQNPSHALANELVVRGISPFVKIELIRDNPLRVPTENLLRWIDQANPGLSKLMRSHIPTLTPRNVLRAAPLLARGIQRIGVRLMQAHARAIFDGRILVRILIETAAKSAAAVLTPSFKVMRCFALGIEYARKVARRTGIAKSRFWRALRRRSHTSTTTASLKETSLR